MVEQHQTMVNLVENRIHYLTFSSFPPHLADDAISTLMECRAKLMKSLQETGKQYVFTDTSGPFIESRRQELLEMLNKLKEESDKSSNPICTNF